MIKSYGFWSLQYDFGKNIKGLDFKYYRRNVELYYDHNKKLWVHRDEYTGDWYPSGFPCHSLKAAKRHLKKHDEIPKGSVFRLVSRYVGCDIWLVK